LELVVLVVAGLVENAVDVERELAALTVVRHSEWPFVFDKPALLEKGFGRSTLVALLRSDHVHGRPSFVMADMVISHRSLTDRLAGHLSLRPSTAH
jgi:hypothetical protein